MYYFFVSSRLLWQFQQAYLLLDCYEVVIHIFLVIFKGTSPLKLESKLVSLLLFVSISILTIAFWPYSSSPIVPFHFLTSKYFVHFIASQTIKACTFLQVDRQRWCICIWMMLVCTQSGIKTLLFLYLQIQKLKLKISPVVFVFVGEALADTKN